MTAYHLAQLNVAHALAPLDTPLLADFVAKLDEINALADTAPGFVWRLQSESGNATEIRHNDDPLLIINMSVWQSAETLFEYVYKTAHTAVMARRREWFSRPQQAFQVLWWIPAGTTPNVGEAMARLAHLQAHGPTPHAFSFKQRFAAPQVGDVGDAAAGGTPPGLEPAPYCHSWNA
jgi:hypothetical protein